MFQSVWSFINSYMQDCWVLHYYTFNFTYRHIDNILSINNPDFENYLGKINLVELEIKDMTESNTSASYLDLILVSLGRDGQLHTSIYDKQCYDDFNFQYHKLSFLSSNIPTSSKLMASLSCSLNDMPGNAPHMDVLFSRAMQLSNKLLKQGYLMERSNSSLRKFYGWYGDFIK